MGVVIEICVKYPWGPTRMKVADICNKRISLQLSEVRRGKIWQRDQNRWPWQEDIYNPIGVKSNIIQLFRRSHEAEFRSRCWSLVRMAPQ
jgi:hypothetical protein